MADATLTPEQWAEVGPDLFRELACMAEIATRRWRPLPANSYEKHTLAAANTAIARVDAMKEGESDAN